MTEKKFIGRFALRNIKANKSSSSVIILTLSLVFTLLIMLFSMTGVLRNIFTRESEDVYPNVDVVVSYDEYSVAKLVNKRYIDEDYSNDIDFALSFFNVNVLTQFDGEAFYGNLMSASQNELEILINKDVILKDNEAIITKTFAENHNLKIGDSFSCDILNNTLNYKVADIYQDYGVFSGNSFFVDKNELYRNLYGLDYLDNLGNTLYIKLHDFDKYDFIDQLKNDIHYQNYNVIPAIDDAYISNHAKEVSAMYLGVAVVIIIAIFLVVASLFPITREDIKKELGVVKTLGGNKTFVWKVYLLQWSILLVLSFVISLLLSLVVINLGSYLYGVKGIVFYNVLSSLLALLTVALFIFIGVFLSFRKIENLSIIEQSSNKRYEKIKPHFWALIITFVILVITFVFKPFSLRFNSLIIVLVSIFIALNLLALFLQAASYFIDKSNKKYSFFKLFQNKYLYDNKHIHQSLRVIFISLVVIVIIFSIRTFFNSEVDNFYKEMNFDMALVNINDYQSDLLDDLKEEDVNSADPAVLYQNIIVDFNNDKSELVKFFVSMDRNSLNEYFKFGFSEIDYSYTTTDMPYVILPKNFGLVYNLEPGDKITLDLNYKLKDIKFVVAGFFDTNLDNFIYSNIYEMNDFGGLLKFNSVFMNSDDPDQLYQSLIKKYSINMYYVFDSNTYFGDYVKIADRLGDFFTILTGFMIVCFMIVIYNNTLLLYYDLKPDLAKVKVLGLNNKNIISTLLKEYFLISVIILVIGIIEIIILSKYLKNIILFADYYKDINATFFDILIGFILTYILLLFSYIYYFKKIREIKIIDEMKFY